MANILISNIYYMLTYAFQVLKQSNYDNVSSESFDNVHDLFAAILSKGIAQQLKQGLHREYIGNTEEMYVLRGKLDINGTIKSRINNRRTLACEYDELSENNIFNQTSVWTDSARRCPAGGPRYFFRRFQAFSPA